MTLLDYRQLILLGNSAVLAGGTTALSLLFGLPLGFLLARCDFPLKRLIKLFLLIPLLIPPYIFTLAWLSFFYHLRLFLAGANLETLLPNPYRLPFAIFLLALSFFPIVTFLTFFALSNFDQRLEEAASFFANRLTIFRKITLPLLTPAILAGALIVFLFTLTEFGVPSLLHVNVFVAEIFAQFSAFFDYRQAFILNWPLLLLTGMLLLLISRLDGKRPFWTITGSGRPLRLIQLNSPLGILALIYVLFLLFLAVILPVAILVIQTRTFSNLWLAFKTSRESLLNSLWLSALAASLMVLTLLPFILCYYHATVRGNNALGRKWSSLLRVSTISPLVFPSISLGIILIWIFNRAPLTAIYTSFWMLITGFTVRFLPFVSETLHGFLGQIDPKLIEATNLTGASTLRIYRLIILPLLLPGLVVSWLIGFILSLSELGISLLLAPPGWQTLPVRIYILLHYGAPELVAALSLILILTVVIIVGSTLLYARRVYF